MDIQALRRYTQITLAAIAVLSAVAAGYRYLVRSGSPFGEHLLITPAVGPVGMRPFLDFPGYHGDREINVYLCASATGGVEDCAKLGTGHPGERLRARRIPHELPDTTRVVPGDYVLRAGPDARGSYPERGVLKIVPFKIGRRPRPRSFAGVQPSDLRIGPPHKIATGAVCGSPLFLADGRLAVGSAVVDATTGVTIEFEIDARELAWSPVGDKLAILTTDRKEIRLAAPDGSGAVVKVREARGLLSSLSWSPDGDRLAYISQSDPSTRGGPGPPTVRIINATTGEVSTAGPGLAVAWSPTADLLAVEMSGGVIQASTPTGGRSSLTTGRRPGWSPDGRFVTVVRSSASGGQTGWVVPVQGGSGAPVAGSGVCALAFSPSATSLAVVTEREGATTLLLRSVEAGIR
jgi:hypothetical protein